MQHAAVEVAEPVAQAVRGCGAGAGQRQEQNRARRQPGQVVVQFAAAGPAPCARQGQAPVRK
jgi:hypothetical protein